MFMRFRGGAIGHKSTQAYTKMFEEENDAPANCMDVIDTEEAFDIQAEKIDAYDPSPDQILTQDDDEYDYDNAEPCIELDEEGEEGDEWQDDDFEDDLGPEDGEAPDENDLCEEGDYDIL
jgi:hypothetical protein